MQYFVNEQLLLKKKIIFNNEILSSRRLIKFMNLL